MKSLRIAVLVGALVAGLVLLSRATTIEAPFALLFGWVAFLFRVLPLVQPDGPSELVGLVALVLLAGGVHGLGRAWRPAVSPWRWTWTAAVVLAVVLLFAAGIAVIGVTHQVAWLASSDQLLVGEGLSLSTSTDRKTIEIKSIGLAISNYEDTYQSLPPERTFTPTGEQLHS